MIARPARISLGGGKSGTPPPSLPLSQGLHYDNPLDACSPVRVPGLPASSKPLGKWKGFPARGRIGGASERRAPPRGGLPSASAYSLQPPSFLAEESEALRPAAVPHCMPPRCRRFSSSSSSKPKPRPVSRIRAARADWGFGDRGLAGRSAAEWEARATGGTGARNKGSGYSSGRRVAAVRGRRAGQRALDSLVVLMAPRSPQIPKLRSSDRLLAPKEASLRKSRAQAPPSGAPRTARSNRLRHTPRLSRAPIGRSLGCPASSGDWVTSLPPTLVYASQFVGVGVCFVGSWPD